MTLQARLYDLESGQVIPASFRYTGSGKGPVSFELPGGGSCTGEYITVAGGSTTWGSVFSSVHGPYASSFGSGSLYATEIENKQKGQAIATCPDRGVIECEYVTSALSVQGYGACESNLGQRYKLMF